MCFTPLGKLRSVYFALKENQIKVQKCDFKGFTSYLRPVLDLWINFPGRDKLLKIVKIRLAKILSLVHFSKA